MPIIFLLFNTQARAPQRIDFQGSNREKREGPSSRMQKTLAGSHGAHPHRCLCMQMYFQYILWSFAQKCKDGTVDHGDTFLVVPLPASSLHHHGNHRNQSGIHESSEGGHQSEDNVPMAIPVRVGVPVTGIRAPSSGEGQGGYSIGAGPPPSFAPSAYNPASGPGEWRGVDRYTGIGGGAIPAAWGAAPPANTSGFVMDASAPVMTEDVIPRAEAVPAAQASLR